MRVKTRMDAPTNLGAKIGMLRNRFDQIFSAQQYCDSKQSAD